jgi:hypothetical protein
MLVDFGGHLSRRYETAREMFMERMNRRVFTKEFKLETIKRV